MKEGYVLLRVKRRWVPEWLWSIASHTERFFAPLVYFNDLTKLLSTDDLEEMRRALEEAGVRP